MYENKEEYEVVVKREVVLLEWALGRRIRHNEGGLCPKCGNAGTFDIKGLGFDSHTGNSIYYSTVFNEWRCRLCDYRMCA